MIRLRYFNKKIKFKLHIKTQNTKYELKLKSKQLTQNLDQTEIEKR